MRKDDIHVCIMRVGGTNCDDETRSAFEGLDVKAEVVHMNRVLEKRNLMEYQILVFPGGFSYGDYVRAGAIFGRKVAAKLGHYLSRFIDEGRPILGICNGFQILVEAGQLPRFKGVSEYPEAALTTNMSSRFECRWVYLKHENRGNCIFTKNIPRGAVLKMPVAHAEGRFIFPRESEKSCLNKLYENDQLVFRYCDEDGEYAGGKYPVNPNGSFHDIAGICDPDGTILGMMPHPERAYHGWQLFDWTTMEKVPEEGDGKIIFESVVEYVAKRF